MSDRIEAESAAMTLVDYLVALHPFVPETMDAQQAWERALEAGKTLLESLDADEVQ